MASEWYSLVSQKLALARALLDAVEQPGVTADSTLAPTQKLQHEAAIQGSTELLLRARKLVLVMIAELYQQRAEKPSSLEDLASLLGGQAIEVEQLRALEKDSDSWWTHLDQLETGQSRPPAAQKNTSADNIIAISAGTRPDRSTKALRQTLIATKQFADNLEEQHGEW